jgi:hypothetical protein
MKPKKKLTTKPLSYYRNKADKAYQEAGARQNTCCIICGGTYNCLHHFFTKGSSSALRYDLDNGIPICVSCHVKIHKRQDPSMIETILRIKGQDWYDRLNKKRYQPVKPSKKYYQEIIDNLTNSTNLLL